jgi:site-specific recombinase XerD
MVALVDALTNAATVADRVSITEARALAADHLAATGAVTELSLERFTGLWARFDRFAGRVCGVGLVQEVDHDIVAAFLRARTTTGSLPAASTVRARVTAVRLLFRVLRQLRLATSDPTLDVELPRRSYPGFRPLVDDEIDRCRWAALATTAVTRDPAVWAHRRAVVDEHGLRGVRNVRPGRSRSNSGSATPTATVR